MCGHIKTKRKTASDIFENLIKLRLGTRFSFERAVDRKKRNLMYFVSKIWATTLRIVSSTQSRLFPAITFTIVPSRNRAIQAITFIGSHYHIAAALGTALGG